MKVLEDAVTHVHDMLPSNTSLRVGVKAGGCQGFEQVLEQIVEPDHDDILVAPRIYVDHMSIVLLQHAQLMFVNNLSGSGLRLHIPEATSTCGCGVSFNI